MPRPRSVQPAYQFHISGQARVTLDGRDFYLGPHESEESYARYYALLAEYNSNGKRAPKQPTKMVDEAILVRHVVADYTARVLPRYKNNQGAYGRLKIVLAKLDELFADVPANEFGPRKLDALRDRLIGTGNSRGYINDQVRDVVRIFRHGVARELCVPDVYQALEALEPLKRGQAPDRPKRGGVELSEVEKTLPYLSPTLQAMVHLQLATACRPSELFRMTPAQVDRRGKVWIYRPDRHKTAQYGKPKTIPINAEAEAVLRPFLSDDPNELCFQTTKGTAWNKDSYRRQITRAAKQAKAKHWTPYQLRHASAQKVRDKLGAEAAQAILGHSRLSTTEVYAKASEAKAVAASEVTPVIG